VPVEPLKDVVGQGQAHQVVAHAGVSLKGRTNATFDGGRFHTENVVTEAGQTCKGCGAKQCVHVTGNVVSAYHVTTSVSLPSMAQFAKLTACQRERVRDAIQNQLAPHEQDHVTAFSQYNGTSTQAFDLTDCRAAVTRQIDKMARDEERQRRADAQTASDALDPFEVPVDLDCTDTSTSGTP
jgi:hypothetical protein